MRQTGKGAQTYYFPVMPTFFVLFVILAEFVVWRWRLESLISSSHFQCWNWSAGLAEFGASRLPQAP